ncbi:hypothetical protein FRC07_013915, partial [Ceratobasidium sp. 392]
MPTNQQAERLMIKEAMHTVNSELDSLILEEKMLRDMRASLITMRNGSVMLAPVNRLPPEILATILALAKECCIHDGGPKSHSFDG